MFGLRASHRRILVTAAVAATALGLAGCAAKHTDSQVAHDGPPVAGPSAMTGSSTPSGSATAGGPTGSAGSGTSGAAQSNKASAATAADKILAAFVPPAGAVPLYAPPPGAGPITANLPNFVQKAAYWRVDKAPDTVFPLIVAPKGVTSSATTGGSGPGGSIRGKIFEFGVVKGVLAQQELEVSVTASGGGTLLSAVARVQFYPARTATATIPADLKVLTVSYRASSMGVVTDKNEYGPVTVTDSSKVAQVAAVINALPPSAGPRPCPMVNGAMTLVFRTSATATPGATVGLQPGGCGQVEVRQGTGLALLDGGEGNPIGQIITILGVNWPRSSNQ